MKRETESALPPIVIDAHVQTDSSTLETKFSQTHKSEGTDFEVQVNLPPTQNIFLHYKNTKGTQTTKETTKEVCVFPMVIRIRLIHGEFGENDHRLDAPHLNKPAEDLCNILDMYGVFRITEHFS